MPGMEHRASPQSVNESEASVVLARGYPTHACAQQPVLLIEQKAAVAHVSVSTEAVAFDSFEFAPKPTTNELSSRGPPPFRPSTPISLHTSLRV